MKITYYGHSCFGVEINGKNIVFDPFISHNELAKHIDIASVKADYILISHGHEDHIADAVQLAKLTGAIVISNFEIVTWLSKQGLEKYHPMNTGGKWIFDFGKVKCLAAEHSSSMPDGSYGGSPMGFLLETSEGDFYYAGDTALMYDMKLIGEYRNISFSFMPIGDNFTMSIDNAIIASDFVKCNKVIGMHYDTFGYIKINKEEAISKFANAGKELILMDIGQTIKLVKQ
jgi:L-ascorbate metabolism protein UlaG (beta-lactamase superfamily)